MYMYIVTTVSVIKMSLIKSVRGKDQLLLDGYRYRRDKLVWRCVSKNCNGRARYDDDIYTAYQDHICQAPNPDEIEKALYNHEIKTNAQQCHDPPRLIIQNARLKISSDAAINIPQYIASQRSIQRIRKDKDVPIEPKTFADIIIPPNYQVNALNEQFLLYDNNDNQRRILIFATKQHLDLLNDCESWHCDGTFAVSSVDIIITYPIYFTMFRFHRKYLSKCILFMVQFVAKNYHYYIHFYQIKIKKLTKNYFE